MYIHLKKNWKYNIALVDRFCPCFCDFQKKIIPGKQLVKWRRRGGEEREELKAGRIWNDISLM